MRFDSPAAETCTTLITFSSAKIGLLCYLDLLGLGAEGKAMSDSIEKGKSVTTRATPNTLRREEWLEYNRAAIASYNNEVEANNVFSVELRTF